MLVDEGLEFSVEFPNILVAFAKVEEENTSKLETQNTARILGSLARDLAIPI